MHKKGWILLGALFLLGLAAAVWLSSRPPAIIEQRLADGTGIRVEGTTYGTNHFFIKGKLVQVLAHKVFPPSVKYQKLIGAPTVTAIKTTNQELVLWYSYLPPPNSRVSYFYLSKARIEDSHGCVFAQSQKSSIFPMVAAGPFGTPGLSFVHFEASPRREKEFKLVTRVKQETLEFSVKNPWRAGFPKWKPELLPARRAVGDAEFVLNGLKCNGEADDKSLLVTADFRVMEKGVDRSGWYRPVFTFMDATGNRSERALCLHESAWKVEGTFYKDPWAEFPEEVMSRLPGVMPPTSGKGAELGEKRKLGGIAFELIGIYGPGEYTFSNRTCVAKAPWNPLWGESISSYSTGQGRVIRRSRPFIMLEVQPLPPDTTLIIHARRKGGRPISLPVVQEADKIQQGTGPVFQPGPAPNVTMGARSIAVFTNRFCATLPEGEEKLDLEFIESKPVRVEFMVRPPERGSPPRANYQ